MVGLGLSFLAMALGILGGRRSVGAGMSAVLAAGYGYGILRARFPDGFSHFIFDASVFGFYLGRLARTGSARPPGGPELYQWATYLIGWPFLIFAMGVLYPQHMLIQLVGLRAAIWFLPFLLLGAWARLDDLTVIARTLAVLNLVALCFAVGEFFLGLEPFFPRNNVTLLLYNSNDVGGGAHRIPATFISAAVYGGTMVASIPLLVGSWMAMKDRPLDNLLLAAALLASAVGTFLCASRSPVIILLALGLVVAYKLRSRLGYLLPVLVLAAVVAYLVRGNERLQRFTSLQDTGMIAERITGSTNMGIVDLILDHPMGAGLGSAFGTSIPSFLQPLVTQEAIGAENEFARIAIEQSLIGSVLWLAFLVWLLWKRRVGLPGDWGTAEQLMRLLMVFSWGTAFIGCGTLSTIPGTCLLLFQMGVLGRAPVRRRVPFRPAGSPEPTRAVPGAGAPILAGRQA